MAMMTYWSTPFPWYKLSPVCLHANIPLQTTQLVPEWSFMEKAKLLPQKIAPQQAYNMIADMESEPVPDDSDVWIKGSEQTATNLTSQCDPAHNELTDSDATHRSMQDQIVTRSRPETAIHPANKL